MKVLIAVDDKSFGDVQANFIVDHVWPPQTEFKVIHVLEPLTLSASDISYMEFLEDTEEAMRKEGEILVRSIALKLRDKFKSPHVEEGVFAGHAKEVILDEANTWPADIVCLGSHGRKGVNRFLLGSVSTAVVSHAPCSVIVLRLPKSDLRPE